jgi:glycosyltransferase involved in cell wall biosynthesis
MWTKQINLKIPFPEIYGDNTIYPVKSEKYRIAGEVRKDKQPLRDARSLRIAYFTGSMKPGQDGVTHVLYRMIDALNKQGIENVFYSTVIPPLAERPTQMVLIPSLSLPMYKEYRFAFPGRKYFAAHLSAFKPDLIHINSPCTLGYAAVQFGLEYDIPVVATYHTHFPAYAGYYKIQAMKNFGWSYLRNLYNNCRRTYVPSLPVLNELREHGINNLKFLPHGVDVQAFHPRFRSNEWKSKLGIEGKFALLYVGRLVWEKDLHVLTEAYRILHGCRSDIAFVLVGDGPIRAELQHMMPQAIFMGYQSGINLSKAYASSDLFIFPSTTETFGIVILEAMASGLVPVCARRGGARGIIQSGFNGILTHPQDAQHLAGMIEHLLKQPELRMRMAQRSRAYAQQQSWDFIFQNQFSDYYAVIQNGINYKRNGKEVA